MKKTTTKSHRGSIDDFGKVQTSPPPVHHPQPLADSSTPPPPKPFTLLHYTNKANQPSSCCCSHRPGRACQSRGRSMDHIKAGMVVVVEGVEGVGWGVAQRRANLSQRSGRQR